MTIRAHHGMRGLGTDVGTGPIWSQIYDPTTYLQNVVTQLNASGGMTSADAQATLTQALLNNYCTPENPSPACHDPSAAAALINSLTGTVAAPSAGYPSTAGQFGFQYTPPTSYSLTPLTSEVYTVNGLNVSAPQPTVITPAQQVSALIPPSTGTGVTSGSVGTAQNVSGNPVLGTGGGGSTWLTDPSQDLIPNFPNWGLLAAAGGVLLLVMMSGRR